MNSLNELSRYLDMLSWYYNIIIIAVVVCIILIAYNVKKIKDVECKPFQNKRPDYPNKVIELLQNILVAQQKQNDEIRKLKDELETAKNGGVKTRMKSKETQHHEEIVQLHNKQIELLNKILETTSGEEKKKLMEKWKQATDLLNDVK